MIALCSDPDLNVFRWLPCWLQSDHFYFRSHFCFLMGLGHILEEQAISLFPGPPVPKVIYELFFLFYHQGMGEKTCKTH